MEKDQNKAAPDAAMADAERKRKAVEDLLHADEEAPEYSQEELGKYRTRRGIRLPRWLKLILIKAWFYASVCFFILWGLGTYVTAQLDMLFILGVVMGMVTDLLINNVLRFLEKYPGENDDFMMFPKKRYLTFVLNILYCFVILLCVFFTYNLLNLGINRITGQTDAVPLGVEPILFGVFCMGYDMLFIALKRMAAGMIQDAKDAAGGNGA